MFASLVRILVIIGVAAGAGYIRARNLPWIPDVEAIKQREDLDKWLRENRGLTLQGFLERIEQGWLVIDARPADAFAKGHLQTDSYPPVLNVPPEEIDQHVERLTHPDVYGLPLVLYRTSETCEYAEELYTKLEAIGFVEIWIYFPGWEGIVEAGLPTATGPDTWTGRDEETEPSIDEESGENRGDEPPDPNAPQEIEP